MKIRLGRTARLVAVVGIILVLLTQPVEAQGWSPRQLNAALRGSGATSTGPLYQSWFGIYKTLAPGVTLTYASVGSGQGIREFINGQADWGTSEAASAEGRVVAAVPDALHIPLAIGAVVPSYNLPGVANLRFSATSLAGIYLGTITRWNDPAIVADNLNAVLPNTPIVPLYRSDGSGATAIVTDFLSSASDAWKQQVGAGTSVRWPTGWGVAGNAGMANAISRTRGALGYLAPGFATANRLPVGAVRNAAGVYVVPSTQTLTAAVEGAEYPDSLVMSIVNAPGANAYPLAGFTYALLRGSSASNATKMAALTDFLYWSLTQGGGRLTQQDYAPLPNDLRRLAIAQLRGITVNGRRVFDGPIT